MHRRSDSGSRPTGAAAPASVDGRRASWRRTIQDRLTQNLRFRAGSGRMSASAMSTTCRVAIAIVLAPGVFVGCGPQAKKKPLTLQEMIQLDPLPLAKGTRWTYNVTVKRFDPDTDKET